MRDRQVAAFLLNHTGFVRGVISSEKPSDTNSLSDVLEQGQVPTKFFLSQKACRGILRRAEKRGRELPPALRQALTQAATADKTTTNTDD